jgi:hypothetical protein
MQKTLRKRFHSYNAARAARAVVYHAARLSMALVLFSSSSFAMDSGDVMRAFSSDFQRMDPVRMKGQYLSAIGELSGMKCADTVKIEFKGRGDVRQESFERDMKSQRMSDEASFSSYEYLLKQFQIIGAESNLKDLLRNSFYDQTYGFYDPKTKNLVIMERTANQIVATILLHELMHAAQDSAVDLQKYQDRHCGTLDSCLAAMSLVEGQAMAIDLLLRIEQNLKDKTSGEILKTVYERMQTPGNEAPTGDQTDFLTQVKLFPYSEGIKFVIGRRLDNRSFSAMFEQAPVSTAQILHPEKFQADRKPLATELSGKKEALGKLPGVKLLMDTALGEYYIRAILGQKLKDDPAKIREAAAGWAGETIFVFRNDHGNFFVWETLWDTPKDSDEFYQCYLDFSKIRRNAPLLADGRSELLVQDNGDTLYLVKKDNRVLIVEGALTVEQFKRLGSILGR